MKTGVAARGGTGVVVVVRGRPGARLAARFAALAALLVAASLGLLSAAAGASWLEAVPLTATGTDSQTGLNHTPLVYDRDGGLHVVWAEQDTPEFNYQIYARHRAWATWGAAELVVPYLDLHPGSELGAKYPSLMARGDSLFMAWHDYRVGGIRNSEIFFEAYDVAGGVWGAALRLTTTLNTSNPGDNGLVPTVVDAGGADHVLWYDYRWLPETSDVFGARRTASGWVTALGDSADVDVSRGAAAGWCAGAPAVAGDPAGRVHAVWADHRQGVDRIRHALYEPAGGWSPAVSVTEPGEPVSAPTVALAADGWLHAVWVEQVAPGRALVTRSRAPGGVWTPPTVLTDPADLAGDPCLIADPTGDLHLVWQDARQGLLDRQIFYRRRAAGTAWETGGASDVQLSDAAGRSERPSIVADERGNLAVVWRDQRSGVYEIWLREFRPAGPIAVADPAGGEPGAAGPAVMGPPLVRGPNPSRAGVRLAAPLEERLGVWDVAGRRVTVLPPGTLAWDGRASDGRRLGAGVYLLRAARSGRQARVVLLP